MINQWGFLVKFILQVLKWYMFPGIVLTMMSSTPPPRRVNEKKFDFFLTYFSHKLYNMCIYCSTRDTNVQLEYPWLDQNLFHQVVSLTSYFHCGFYQRCIVSKITDDRDFLNVFFKKRPSPVCFKSRALNTSTLSSAGAALEEPASGEMYISCSKTYEGISYNQIYGLKTVGETGVLQNICRSNHRD